MTTIDRLNYHLSVAAVEKFEKAIRQFKDEAASVILEALGGRDGLVALYPIDRDTAWIYFDADEISHRDAAGNGMSAVRRRFEPESWRNVTYMRGHWHPAYWSVHLTRVDDSGRRWGCDLGRHVVDDFGGMVVVEGIAP